MHHAFDCTTLCATMIGSPAVSPAVGSGAAAEELANLRRQVISIHLLLPTQYHCS
jgi:hypothetical protein